MIAKCALLVAKLPCASVKWDIAEGVMTKALNITYLYFRIVCHPVDTVDSFLRGREYPLRMVELYLHSIIHLCGVVRN
jgi:hypothetical protein